MLDTWPAIQSFHQSKADCRIVSKAIPIKQQLQTMLYQPTWPRRDPNHVKTDTDACGNELQGLVHTRAGCPQLAAQQAVLQNRSCQVAASVRCTSEECVPGRQVAGSHAVRPTHDHQLSATKVLGSTVERQLCPCQMPECHVLGELCTYTVKQDSLLAKRGSCVGLACQSNRREH